MSDFNPLRNSISFNALVKSNKEQFDKIFNEQMKSAGLTETSRRPATQEDLISAGVQAENGNSSGEIADVIKLLNDRFGSRWSSEVVKHNNERGVVTVLCKLSVNDTSNMQFGSARINGNLGAALQKATDNALVQCAQQIGAGEASKDTGLEPHSPVDPASEPHRRDSPGNGVASSADTATKSAGVGKELGLDSITLDLIENTLRNARHEMDAVLFRSAMSPVIREQHDEFPMITDAKGRMIVGQFGSYISEMLKEQDFSLSPGDIILQSDPFKCGGAVSHINDWMVLAPVFFDGELVGFSSMFGHMMDVGGPVPCSMPTAATSIYGEGIRIPPIKIADKGDINQAALDILMNNTRTPEMNYSDLMAIIAGCRAGEKRIMEICDRFGKETYKQACEALLERTNRAMRHLIVQNLPEEPVSFEDYVDDDGLGNGPFKLKLSVWREGDQAYFDWTGTSPQAPGPINFYLHEGMFKMFIGVYMIMVFDPQILFNDGFYDLIHVTLPKGSLLRPNFPAALGCRTHALSRQFDVLGGALSKNTPEMATAAGYGSSPHFLYSGVDSQGRSFQLMEILYGGIPGRPIGDGMDGHSWWPLFENIPTEYLESYYPILIENYASIPNSGGAGLHRGGNGVEKVYLLLEEGEISIHDDRNLTQPWGILGGKPGAWSEKLLVKKDGTEEHLPAKVDNIKVRNGDRIVFRTAGGGGWGDPLERDPNRVRNDVARKLMTSDVAKEDYGVILTVDDFLLEHRATEECRESIRRNRKALPQYDYGEMKNGGNLHAAV